MQYLGVGIGLRRQFYHEAMTQQIEVDWFEVIPENFMDFGGYPWKVLREIKKKFPLVSHGVGLSLGSISGLDNSYLSRLKDFVNEINCPWFSDHLCFSSIGSHVFHDLLPIPRTDESLKVVCGNIDKVQNDIKRPFAIENISFYGESNDSQYSESEFISEIIKRTGCYLLLDINNVYVNHQNLGLDPYQFIKSIPLSSVVQFHLAGHWDRGDVVIDTHGDEVCQEVWELFDWTLDQISQPVSTLIEWDNDIPSLHAVIEQANKAKNIISRKQYEQTQPYHGALERSILSSQV